MSTTAPQPPDEAARLEAIRRYDILDTPPDGAFDRITSLAARLCRAPISTITIVDEDRVWFKSAHGVEVDEIGRDPGLCASAIMHDSPHIVTDAIEDPRTLENPLVRGELGLRFYVGIPLRTANGHNLGTLNVIDVEPRQPTEEELDALNDLAEIVVDELELRLAARRTIQLEAAKEAAEFRESLLAGISHEMRTPISILNGIAGLEPDDDVDLEAMRGVMRRQVRQLDWLISQYLDFTTIESGRRPPTTPVRLDLTAVVPEVAEILASDGTIEVDIEDDARVALADRNATRQILLELVNNALRFSPRDSAITIQTRPLGEDEVALTVADRGPGIPERDLERIFGKLHRGGNSVGSGIGLYVARALAEAQGGRLTVTSTPGEGSRFTLVLPRAV